MGASLRSAVRGTQFYANKRNSKGFARHIGLYLGSKDIKHIPFRRNNPQTNGKMERWFREYGKHRSRFESARELMDWYNVYMALYDWNGVRGLVRRSFVN